MRESPMLMTVIGKDPSASNYGELAGIRVLINGLTPACGVDVARSFADHRGRIILHTDRPAPECDVLAGVLAETASQVEHFTGAYSDADSAIKFAQTAAQTFGGLDAIINLIPISSADLHRLNDLDQVEDMVTRKLSLPLQISRVVANRMRVLMTEGLVLNIMTVEAPRSSAEAMLVGVARTALAAMTRGEATLQSGHGVRVNAIGPRAASPDGEACLASEPDVAALALYLASNKGKSLTGHVFDAAGVAARRC
jgi:3-oxoacyl-[acyl-carrier protein] reductase